MDTNEDIIAKEVKKTENEKKMLYYKANLAKSMFIDEIKNGLGEEIKKNCNKIEIIKPNIWQRISKIIGRFFTSF